MNGPPMWCSEHMEPLCPRHTAEIDAPWLADLSAAIRDYLTTETDVSSPSFHATALTHRLAARVTPPGQDRP